MLRVPSSLGLLSTSSRHRQANRMNPSLFCLRGCGVFFLVCFTVSASATPQAPLEDTSCQAAAFAGTTGTQNLRKTHELEPQSYGSRMFAVVPSFTSSGRERCLLSTNLSFSRAFEHCAQERSFLRHGDLMSVPGPSATSAVSFM